MIPMRCQLAVGGGVPSTGSRCIWQRSAGYPQYIARHLNGTTLDFLRKGAGARHLCQAHWPAAIFRRTVARSRDAADGSKEAADIGASEAKWSIRRVGKSYKSDTWRIPNSLTSVPSTRSRGQRSLVPTSGRVGTTNGRQVVPPAGAALAVFERPPLDLRAHG